MSMNHHWYCIFKCPPKPYYKGSYRKNRMKLYDYEWMIFLVMVAFWDTVWYHVFMWDFLSDSSMIKTDILSRDTFIVEYSMIWLFLKTMIPRDRWLRHWFGGLVWCLVLLVGRLLRDSLRPSSLFSLAKYQQPNDITKKRSRKRKSSKKSTTEKSTYP